MFLKSGGIIIIRTSILQPLEVLLKTLLLFFYDLTSNFGISLILLSFSVTVIMLPLFWFAERLQKKDRIKKNEMASALSKLDDVTNQQEKYYYTREIYKQHGYHPVQSLKGLFGLLIQIPFFIAAYRMLGDFESLSGISFGPITDLFAPDGLLFGINLLPFLMTGINLLSGYFYAQDMDNSEKMQLIVIAGVFLVLLYDQPAALVFYWTMNNSFSIGKNWLLGHKPRLPRKKARVSKERKGWISLRQHKALIPVMASGALLVTAIVIDRGSTVLKGVLVILLEILIAGQFVFHVKETIWKERRIFLGGFAAGSLLVHCFLIFREPHFFQVYRQQMIILITQVPVLLILAFYTCVEPFRDSLEALYKRQKKNIDIIAILSISLLIGLVFFYSPITIHVSDVEAMPFSITRLVLWHFLYAAIVFSLGYVFYRFSAPRLKPVLAALFTALALIAWIYTYLLPGDYGVLDALAFTEPGRLAGFNDLSARELILLAMEFLGLIFVLAVAFYLAVKYVGQVVWIIAVLSVMTFGQTFFNVVSTEGIGNAGMSESAFLPNESEHVFRFSREKNIVVFVLDMIGADHIPDILEEYPDIRESLNGFVWYPSTISAGIVTYGSLPSILAGPDYTPDAVNSVNNRTMNDMIRDAYAYYPEVCKKNGYDMTFIGPVYFQLADYADEWGITVADPLSYMEYWLNTSTEGSNLNLDTPPSHYALLFSVIGLFKSSPHFLRPYIYLDGRWLMLNRGNLGFKMKMAIANLGMLDLFDSLSSVDDGKPTFKFMYNRFTHFPWVIGENLQLEQKIYGKTVLDPKYNVYVVEDNSAYRTAVRALYETKAFLGWLDKAGIRDQTKVVIVSDHGYTGIHKQWTDFPVFLDANGTPVKGTSLVNSILLVKDFNSNNPFRIDKRLMSTADTPSIALSSSEDPTVGEPKEREVVVSFTRSHQKVHGPYHYTISHQYTVSGDPSRSENWVLTK